MEEGAVLQVIQIFLQYLSSTCCLQLFSVAMAADVTFFNEGGKMKKGKEPCLVLSDLRKKTCSPDLSSFACIVVTL